MTSFSTKIWISLPNVETLHVVSPKTGRSIHIYSGWFSEIPEDLARKIWGAWNDYNQAARAYKEAHPENVWAREQFTRSNDCKIELTVNDFQVLFNIHTAQQKKLAAGSPARRRR